MALDGFFLSGWRYNNLQLAGDDVNVSFQMFISFNQRWFRASTGVIVVPDNTKVLSVQFYPIEKVKSAR